MLPLLTCGLLQWGNWPEEEFLLPTHEKYTRLVSQIHGSVPFVKNQDLVYLLIRTFSVCAPPPPPPPPPHLSVHIFFALGLRLVLNPRKRCRKDVLKLCRFYPLNQTSNTLTLPPPPRSCYFLHGVRAISENKISGIFSVCAPPPQFSGSCILFAPPDAHAIFLHNDLTCNDTCTVTGGCIAYWGGGGTNWKDPISGCGFRSKTLRGDRTDPKYLILILGSFCVFRFLPRVTDSATTATRAIPQPITALSGLRSDCPFQREPRAGRRVNTGTVTSAMTTN